MVVAEEGLDEVVEGATGFLAAPARGAPVLLGVVDRDELVVVGLAPTLVGADVVLGAETGLVVLAGAADFNPGFLAGPLDAAVESPLLRVKPNENSMKI